MDLVAKLSTGWNFNAITKTLKPDEVNASVLRTAVKYGYGLKAIEYLLNYLPRHGKSKAVDASVLAAALGMCGRTRGERYAVHGKEGKFSRHLPEKYGYETTKQLAKYGEFEVIKLLVDTKTEAVLQNAVLLKIALEVMFEFKTIELLVAAKPEAVDTECINIALEKNRSIETIKLLVDAKREAVGTECIKVALSKRCRFVTIKLLVDAKPEAVDTECIKVALKTGWHSFKTIKLLVAAKPVAVDTECIKFALETGGHSFETIKLLFDAKPEAVDMECIKVALEGGGHSFETIKLLFDAKPEAVDTECIKVALKTGGHSFETIKLLFGAKPEAVDTECIKVALKTYAEFLAPQRDPYYNAGHRDPDKQRQDEAILGRRFETIKLLVDAKAEAVDTDCIKIALNTYISSYRQDYGKEVVKRNFEVVKLLVGAKPELLAVDTGFIMDLLKAIERSSGPVWSTHLKFFVDAKPEAVDRECIKIAVDKFIHKARCNGEEAALRHFEVVKLLVGAKPEAVDTEFIMDLLRRKTGEYKCFVVKFEMMKLFVDAKADAVDTECIKIALTRQHNFEMIKLLVDVKAEAVDATILGVALQHEHEPETFKLLIDTMPGAVQESHFDELHATTPEYPLLLIKQFPLPLHRLIRSGAHVHAANVIASLLKAGADPTEEDDQFLTPVKAVANHVKAIRAKYGRGSKSEWIADLEKCKDIINGFIKSGNGKAKGQKVAEKQSKKEQADLRADIVAAQAKQAETQRMLDSARADIVQLKKDRDAAVLEAANANERKEKAAEEQPQKEQADLPADIAAAQAKQAETQRMLESARADIVQLQREQLVERTGAAMAHAVLGNQIATLQGQVAELTTTTVFNVETGQDERVVLGAAKLISDRKRQRAETPDSARKAAAYRIETGNAVKKIKLERDTATLSRVSALRRLETVQQKAAATHAACEQAKEDLEDAQDMNQDMINFDAQQKVLVDKLKAQVQGLGGNPVC
eukprot:gene10354-22267_t